MNRLPLSCTSFVSGAVLAAVLATVLSLGGCGGASESELMDSARNYLAKNELESARLQLKTLLQSSPESGEARFMLGKLMHDLGEMPGAEIELRRSLEARYAEAKVLPVLADTLLAQGKGKLLLQQFGSTDLSEPQANAELKTLLAAAKIAAGDRKGADALLEQALERAADNPQAMLLRARLSAVDGDGERALKQVRALLATTPSFAPAWLFKGDLLHFASPGDPAAAITAWRECLKLEPRNSAAHSAVIDALIAAKDLAGAKLQWAELKKALPRHQQTRYFEAVLADYQGDSKRALELADQMLRSAPNSPRVLMLAGHAALKLGALEQAETLLIRAVQSAPKAAAPRRLLAQTLIRMGKPDQALAAIKPQLEAKSPDPVVLALAAQGHLLKGDSKAAEAYFSSAAKLRPGDPKLRTARAMLQMAQGDDKGGLQELQEIAAADTGTNADLALINARLGRNDLSGARKAVDVLAAKTPLDALPDQLRGRIALQTKDRAGARKHFEQALMKNADYMPALSALAVLDLAAKQPAAARERFEAAVKRNPKLVAAMLALAEINTLSGGKDEDTAQWLNKAITADPTEARARLLLVQHYLDKREARLALSAAQVGAAALPNNADLLERVGSTQLLTGDAQQAVSSFGKLAALQPTSPLPQLRLAEAHAAAKNPVAAAAAVRRALEIAPDSQAALRASANLALMEKKSAQALTTAHRMQSAHPTDMQGFMMEGEVEMRQKNWDAAAVAFRKALTKPKSGGAAQRLHAALLAGKKTGEADKLAGDWRKSHPADMGFVMYLADAAMGANRLPQAEALYREMTVRQPRDVRALNNLAYTLALQNKPGAVALAEQALRLTPDSPLLMDTLALSLASEHQLAKAISLQAKVVAMAPGAPQYRLQLAKFQLQAGDKASARIELDTLSRLGAAFPRQAEVAELLKASGT